MTTTRMRSTKAPARASHETKRGLILMFVGLMLAMFLALVVAGPWMLTLMTDYMRTLFTNLPAAVG